MSALCSKGQLLGLANQSYRSNWFIAAASPYTANRIRIGCKVRLSTRNSHTKGHSTRNIHHADAIIIRRLTSNKLTRDYGNASHIANNGLTNFYKKLTINKKGKKLYSHSNLYDGFACNNNLTNSWLTASIKSASKTRSIYGLSNKRYRAIQDISNDIKSCC